MKQPVSTSSSLLQNGARISLALFILLLPKCGLCLVVYLNVFSIMGISITKYFPYFLPVLGILLMLNLFLGFMKARKIKHYGSWIISLIASVVLIVNKIWFDEYVFSWIAVSLLLIAAVIQIWISRKVCSRSLL